MVDGVISVETLGRVGELVASGPVDGTAEEREGRVVVVASGEVTVRKK